MDANLIGLRRLVLQDAGTCVSKRLPLRAVHHCDCWSNDQQSTIAVARPLGFLHAPAQGSHAHPDGSDRFWKGLHGTNEMQLPCVQ